MKVWSNGLWIVDCGLWIVAVIVGRICVPLWVAHKLSVRLFFGMSAQGTMVWDLGMASLVQECLVGRSGEVPLEDARLHEQIHASM